MAHYIIKKWIEPYVLLETLKSHYDMTEYTFDGASKISVKDEFIKQLHSNDTFGLYMKNVNKFYLFKGKGSFDIEKMFSFTPCDYEITEDYNEPLKMVDYGRAEAGIIMF